MSGWRIVPLGPLDRDALSRLLIDSVAKGGSLSFMHPLTKTEADAFWDQSLAAAAKGQRIILGALTPHGELIGTVTLHLDCPPNQPHRAEIAKMMTRSDWRGRGVGRALLSEAERLARLNQRSLLVLDTAVVEGASDFYRGLGYVLAGTIPDFAFTPHGDLTGTNIFYKNI